MLRKILMEKKAASMRPTRPLILLSSLLRRRKKNSFLRRKLEQLSILTLHSSTMNQFLRIRKLKPSTAPYASMCLSLARWLKPLIAPTNSTASASMTGLKSSSNVLCARVQ